MYERTYRIWFSIFDPVSKQIRVRIRICEIRGSSKMCMYVLFVMYFLDSCRHVCMLVVNEGDLALQCQIQVDRTLIAWQPDLKSNGSVG